MSQIKYVFLPALILLSLASSNCMTMLTMTNYQEHYEPVVYGGVRTSLGYEPHAHNIFGGVIRVFQYIDLPFSLVLDTVVLPATIPLAAVARSNERDFERNGNEYVRLIMPDELKMLVDARQQPSAEGLRPFHPGQESIQESDPSFRQIRFPVRFIEKGVPGCYLHCAAASPDTGILSLGKVGGKDRSSVGLIRVAGIYKRSAWYRHVSHQHCSPGAQPGDPEKIVQSSEMASLCNRTFPACKDSCTATNHPYTLYYVNPEFGKVLPQQQ